ncbi:MAG TPA: hypothetical protein VEQ42_03000, partial [Pyrinomonadaceae bacterium]|nr:hypothetical protein [Pyrinomonadaceae bacterium]
EFATNMAPDEQERQQVERLGGIVVGNYEQVPFQHTETRHMERQHRRQYVSPIGVDRTCCLFCAAQLMALDRDRFFAAAEAKDLKGYVFSKYVLYFQRHRARMWGGEVEKLFAALTPNQKVRFLSTLVGKSRGAIKLERAKHDDCGRTLREIEKYLSPAAESINSNNQTQQASADTNPDTLASTSADDDAFWAAAIAMEFDRAVATSLEGAYPPSDAQTATATGVPAPVVGGGGGVVPTEAPTPPTVSDTRAGPGL